MNWTFATLSYTRPDMDKIQTELSQLLNGFEEAATYEGARGVYRKIEKITSTLQTVFTIASIRSTMDTNDAFYAGEMEYLNTETAKLAPVQKRLSQLLLATPFRGAFEKEYGAHLFAKAELAEKTQSEAIVQDLIEESRLCEEYKKLTASCKTEFLGETVNFYGLLKHMESIDRGVRQEAFLKWAALYEGVSEKLDAIYDQLIAVRVRMAETLGFPSYTELAYAIIGRTDYGPEEVEAFRRQVREIIVPAASRLRAAQAGRIGVDRLRYYDEAFMFPEGNADPKGTEAELMAAAKAMYRELSPETGGFFDFMMAHDLFDLQTKPGKHLGGYCTVLPDQQAPFIFANFNGTAGDVGVLTHEAGHAFAAYTAIREQPILDYLYPGNEACEIHSMTMEHFTYPWLDRFYGPENAEKAKYIHLCDALCAIPYLVSVDAFQHRVYANPSMTAMERRAVWREIERAYMPWRDYDGVPFLEQGGFWMQKQHIFLYPFYYIDYALAQTSAFELYGRMKADKADAWAVYMRLIRAAGSLSYTGLLSAAGLSNPFEAGTVERAFGHVIRELGD